MNTTGKTPMDIALANSIASAKMEGYKFTAYHEKLCRDVLTGKMTKQECIKKLTDDSKV